jgi:hypothetical protein
MDPATIALATLILQMAVKYGIPAAQAIVAMFHAPNPPTQADWDAIWSKCQTPFDQGLIPGVLVPDKPPGTVTLTATVTPAGPPPTPVDATTLPPLNP